MNAQQLKNSILQEAIEGRLVPQDPNDEPASVLLEKIRKEKAKLVKEGKLKKKDLEEIPISEDEKPFVIPENWVWIRINDLGEVITGGTPSKQHKEYYGDEYPFYKPGDLDKGINIDSSVDSLSQKGYDASRKLKAFSVLVTCIGATIGKTGLISKDGACNQQINAIIPVSSLFPKYIYYTICSPSLQSLIRKDAGQTTLPIMNKNNFCKLLFPLPPLSEQKRIVAKIEELMPKVDEYGKAQEFLDKLNEELPERLKKSILQEAIEGRLVPQDPNDEPASVLLDKIRKEKARLVKEGKLKKKDLEETPIEENEIPFKIPESWEWTPLSMLIKMISGTSYSKNDVKKDGVRILRGGNIQNNELFLYDDDVFVPFELYDNEKNIAKYDIVIVASTGSKAVIGKPAFIRKTYENVQIGAFLRIIRPHLDLYASYLEMIFSSEYYRKHIRDKVKGTNINNIKSEYIEDLLIPFPPLAEQKRIVAKIEQLMKEIEKLKV